MSNETSAHALCPAFSTSALLIATTVLAAGCIGEAFRAGDGAGGSGASTGEGAGSSSGTIGGGGTGGEPSIEPMQVTWPDSLTARCSNGIAFLPACPTKTEAYYGQDGNYEIIKANYDDGEPVVDRVTKLSWATATVEQTYTFDGALTQCKSLAESVYKGSADWRLPTRRELISIIDYGDEGTFPNIFTTFPDFYWTESDLVNQSTLGWVVSVSEGTQLAFHAKGAADAGRVMCVRGDEKLDQGVFEARRDDVLVLDRSTGLLWERQASMEPLIWRDALVHCESLVLDDKDDWRLPSAKELLSLVDDKRVGPAIDPTSFPGAPAGRFWTSTPDARHADRAIFVDFAYGYSRSEQISEPTLLARCVRSD